MKILFVVLISLFYRFAFMQNPLHTETDNMFYGSNCPEEEDTIKHPLNEPTRSAFYDSYFTKLTDNFRKTRLFNPCQTWLQYCLCGRHK